VQGEAQAILPEPYTLNPTPYTLSKTFNLSQIPLSQSFSLWTISRLTNPRLTRFLR